MRGNGTVTHTALGGRLTFKMRRKTLRTEFEAHKISKGIEDTKLPHSESLAAFLLGTYVSCTVSVEVEFQGKDSQYVKDTVNDFIDWVHHFSEEPDYAEQWNYYLDDLPTEIRTEWIHAYDKANESLVPIEQKDGRLLSPEERKLAADPDSPLVAQDKSS